MIQLQAFHNRKEIKKEYLDRVIEHRKADELIHGTYWEDGKGCAIGCTIHSSQHDRYESELGIPTWLAYLEDTIFEHLPNGNAKLFPEQFLKAIPIGVDLNDIKGKVMSMIVQKALDVLFTLKTDNEQVRQVIEGSKKACQTVIELWKSNTPAWSAAWSAAEYAAWSAARSAESAARSAAESAARSAWSAARSAESAARSARSAARSAWSAARSAAESAARSAWSAAWVDISEELIKILKKVDN